MSGGVFRHTRWNRVGEISLIQQLSSCRGLERYRCFRWSGLDFAQRNLLLPLLLEHLRSDQGLNVPTANRYQDSGGHVDQRMCKRSESQNEKKQEREGETRGYRH